MPVENKTVIPEVPIKPKSPNRRRGSHGFPLPVERSHDKRKTCFAGAVTIAIYLLIMAAFGGGSLMYLQNVGQPILIE